MPRPAPGAMAHAAGERPDDSGGHRHAHGAARSGWMIPAGDALHNKTDGIIQGSWHVASRKPYFSTRWATMMVAPANPTKPTIQK
jgi:hypothetical protein